MFHSRLTICFTYTICGDSSAVNLPMLKDVAEKLQATLEIKSNGNFEMALGNAKVH